MIVIKTNKYFGANQMKHLKDVGMNYFEHLCVAWGMGLALIVHGVVPAWFTTYASDKMKTLEHKN